MGTDSRMVDGAVLHWLDSSKSHIDFAIHIRTYSLETNSRTGLDCSDLGLSGGVLEIELVAAEFWVSNTSHGAVGVVVRSFANVRPVLMNMSAGPPSCSS